MHHDSVSFLENIKYFEQQNYVTAADKLATTLKNTKPQTTTTIHNTGMYFNFYSINDRTKKLLFFIQTFQCLWNLLYFTVHNICWHYKWTPQPRKTWRRLSLNFMFLWSVITVYPYNKSNSYNLKWCFGTVRCRVGTSRHEVSIQVMPEHNNIPCTVTRRIKTFNQQQTTYRQWSHKIIIL